MYAKMPSRMMNARAISQRDMDIDFMGLKDKFVLIYIDELVVYSNSHEEHLQHLRRVFLKCIKFWISLNPKKSQFSLSEGKIVGHIVLAEGVKIDPI